MNKLNVSLSQVQTLVSHASQEGLYVGFSFVFQGELCESMVQLPSRGGEIMARHDADQHRDLVVYRDGQDHSLEVRTELGEIFVDMFMPKAA